MLKYIFIIVVILSNTSQAFFLLPLLMSASSNNKNIKYSLTVEVEPNNAQVRILNIKEKYKDGILLKKGKYHIEIKKNGFHTISDWIEVNRDSKYQILLTPDIKMLENQCANNNKESCHNLGVIYYTGINVSIDYEKSFHYYSLGCELNNSDSCLNLGTMYYYGEGVFEDSNKSKDFLEKSCYLNKNNCQE